MSDKKGKISGAHLGLGDISTIRDILFGEKTKEIDIQLQALQEKQGVLNDEQLERISELTKKTDKRIEDLEKQFEEKVAELEKKMNAHVEELERQIMNVSKSDKQNLAAMLQELSTNLIKGE